MLAVAARHVPIDDVAAECVCQECRVVDVARFVEGDGAPPFVILQATAEVEFGAQVRHERITPAVSSRPALLMVD